MFKKLLLLAFLLPILGRAQTIYSFQHWADGGQFDKRIILPHDSTAHLSDIVFIGYNIYTIGLDGNYHLLGGSGSPASVAWGDVTGKPTFAAVSFSGEFIDLNHPTTVDGYGITDAVKTGGSYSNPSWISNLDWGKINRTSFLNDSVALKYHTAPWWFDYIDAHSGGGGVSWPLSDATFQLKNATTASKTAQFDLSAITASNNRVYTLPDASGILALRNQSQTFSGTQTFGAIQMEDRTAGDNGANGANTRYVDAAVGVLAATLGNAATKNVGTSSGTVAAGDDSRFGNATKIQGKNVSSTAPTDGQVLKFNTTDNQYEPGDESGAGTTQMDMNANQDTLKVHGGNPIPVFPDPHNVPWYNLGAGIRNSLAEIALMIDTSNFDVGTDDHGPRDMDAGNSMVEHIGAELGYITFMDQRFESKGPGYISVGNNKLYATVIKDGDWVLRSGLSAPRGRGLDTYELIGGTAGDSVAVVYGSNVKPLKWTWSNRIDIGWYGSASSGSFETFVDGVSKGITNTSDSMGPHRTVIQGLSDGSHNVNVVITTVGADSVHILSFNEEREGVRGVLYEKVAKGASIVDDWVAIDSADWATQLSWIHPTSVTADWVVTTAGTEDTTQYLTGVTHMMNRIKAVNRLTDIRLVGPTIYSTVAWSPPVSSFDAFHRAILRYCLTNGYAYFDPRFLYGNNIVDPVTRLMIVSDSLHRSPQGSIAEYSLKFQSMGIYSVFAKKFLNIYDDDGVISAAGKRVIDANTNTVQFANDPIFQIRGGTGLANWDLDLSDPLGNISVSTGATNLQFDVPISTNGTVSASGDNINHFNGAMEIGNASLASARTFAIANTSYALAEIETTNSAASSGWENRVAGEPGPAGSFGSVGTNKISDIFDAHSTGVAAFGSGDLNLGANNSSGTGRVKLMTTDASANIHTNLVATEHGNVLVGDDATEVGEVNSSAFTVSSLTKGSIPFPKMTNAQRDALTPVGGMGIWSVDDQQVNVYDSAASAWVALGTGGAGGSSGIYVPTILATSSATAGFLDSVIYSRSGNVITVSGALYCTGSASNNPSSVTISLPVTSNIVTSSMIHGSGTPIYANTASGNGSPATITADLTNKGAKFDWYCTSGSSATSITFTFQYYVR